MQGSNGSGRMSWYVAESSNAGIQVETLGLDALDPEIWPGGA